MSQRIRLAQWIAGAIFIYAGAVKLIEPSEFAVGLGRYRLFHESTLAPLAIVVPCMEIVCGVALIVNRRALGASFLGVLLCLGFVVSLGSAWARHIDIDCGCFGPENAPNTSVALLRAICLLTLLGGLLAYHVRKQGQVHR